MVGRLIAKHLTSQIPGKPDIVVENLKAAGIVLANRLYSDEERDGSIIAVLERSTPQLAIEGNPNVPVRSAQADVAGQRVLLRE